MKKVMQLIGLGLFALLLSACNSEPKEMNQEDTPTASSSTVVEPTVVKTTTPTLFFHGYQGTANSFGHLISRFEKDDLGTKELVLTVGTDGTVTSEGTFTRSANNPLIQVLFADNQNNEWNQAEWVKAVLVYLQETYGVETVNIVGHSMGGVSSFRYLTAYGYDESLPQVAKFVALGAPFNEFIDSTATQTMEDVLNNGPQEQAQRYLDFVAGIANVSQETNFRLIGGQLSETDLSDGMVPLSSALAIHSLLMSHNIPVSSHIIQGVNHSGLHESDEVDTLIEDFLWDKE